MTIDKDVRIGGPGAIPAAGDAARGGSAAGADPVEFRRILERLEALAQKTGGPEVKDAGALQDALREAEDGFRSAMDLRRALEDAFRTRSIER